MLTLPLPFSLPLVWPDALYGSESRIIKANDIDQLKAFEINMLQTCAANQLDCWTDHRTNESVMNDIGADRELVATVSTRKLQYIGYMIRAQNLCTYISECRLDGARGRGRRLRR